MTKPSTCARCGRENDASLTRCVDCGAALRPVGVPAGGGNAGLCPRCSAPLPAGARFCAQCGAAVGADEEPASTDRHATVTPPPGAVPARAAPPRPPPLPGARPAPRVSAVRHDGRPGAALDVAGEALCGRAPGVLGALALADDPTVSPRHARFRADRGALHVEDLGTENGTFLRLRVGSRPLAPGDEIRIGRQLLRLEAMPAAEPGAGGALAWGGPRGRARFRLVQLLDGGGAGEAFPLEPGEHVVGREGGDLTFPDDRYVSARHALLTVSGEGARIADVGSSNGTFVRISGETVLADGDELLVGGQLLRVGR